jgi:hypothetical protein
MLVEEARSNKIAIRRTKRRPRPHPKIVTADER